MRFKLLMATIVSLIVGAVSARAADWPNIEGLGELTQRQSITVENPADVPTEAALVHVALSELAKTLPDAKAGQVAVIDPAAEPAKREQADRNFVPFQVSNETLIFAIPLQPHEKKQLFIYTSPARLNLPGFPAKTAYDSRHAYRSFENNFMAFRMETGPGANTTGMAIDSFGKTKAGKGLRLVEVYEQGDYHKPQVWGVDILKLGSSPGIGGAYVVNGDQLVRPSFDTTVIDCVYQGPVETVIRATAPIEIAGRKLTLERTLTLVADDRSIRDTLTLRGGSVEGLHLGIGLRDLPHPTWAEHPKEGWCMVTGDNNQPGCKWLGIAAVFTADEYVKTMEVPDAKNGGHIYVLEPKSEGALVSHHRFAAIWDGDGQINNPTDLEATLKRWAALRDKPVKITFAPAAETHP
jgi:hypothetical protein